MYMIDEFKNFTDAIQQQYRNFAFKLLAMQKQFFSFVLLMTSVWFWAQVGALNIRVYDEFSKKPLEATVKIQSTGQLFSGVGEIQLSGLASGNYNFEISALDYDASFLNDINIVPNQNLTYSVGLNQSVKQIQEVNLTKKLYKTTIESPVSLRNITSEEVQKNAGSNRDVSRAILSFPGVGSTATFRNDLLNIELIFCRATS